MPRAKSPKRTAASECACGRGRTRTHASVTMPRMPSEPSSIRSGDGPAPGAGQPPRLPRAARRHRAHGLDDVVDVRLDGREVPAGARRDPAAERRQLEGLRVEAQRQVERAQLALERRPGRAGLDQRRARDVVDLQHAVHRAHVERDDAVEARRHLALHAAADARAAAVGHDGDVRARRPLEHGLDVALPARARDDVGREVEAAVKATHDVGVGLAPGVRRAGVVVARADRCEVRRRRDARLRPTRRRRARPACAPRRRRRSAGARRARDRPRAAALRTTRRPRTPSPSACAAAYARP